MAGVMLSGVRKAFGDFVAVHGLDLEIGETEFVSLLGPSGCGKTTTLRMLAGLEFPSEGEISIGGRVVNHVAPGKRNIAMVFQSYALYPHMTVARNIAYPLKKRGVPPAERAQLVAQTAELLQLTELLDRKPRQLSGGQQQRVALGRALVRDPDVFLLDEPLSNLDAKLRSYMRAELVELHRRLGRTMVYVTHDQLEAMTMSDRIAVMNGGHLQQFATPYEVYNRPQNKFVAGFIGTPSMNLIDGALRRQEGGGRILFEAPGLSQPAPGVANGLEGPATLGARPEHVLIGEGAMRAQVRIVEPTGHESIVIVELEGGPQLTARTPAATRLTVGETVPLDLVSDALHVFGGEGQRLNADQDEASEPVAGPRHARN